MYEMAVYTMDPNTYEDVKLHSTEIARGFSHEELANFLKNESYYFKHALFNEYLNKMITDAAAEVEIKKSRAELDELLKNK
jgi:hypothetical protein